MKNTRTGLNKEAKLSAGKRRTRKLSKSKKRGRRATNQILDRVSILDEVDDMIFDDQGVEASELTFEEYHAVVETTVESESQLASATSSEAADLDALSPPGSWSAQGEKPVREKVSRRRQIDPTTCERDYSMAEIEFMNALDSYKRSSGRMFPTCSEILEVLLSLGYRKTTGSEESGEEPPCPENEEPSTPAFVTTGDYREPLMIF